MSYHRRAFMQQLQFFRFFYLPLLVISTFVILCVSSTSFVIAQKFQPVYTSAPSTAFINGQAMYILGGYRNYTPYAQAFMVDLSVSWNISSPAIKQLPNGPPSSFLPSTLSSDGQNWFVLINNTGANYNIKSAKWTSVSTNNFLTAASELPAVTDPETGLIYVLKGYNDGQAMLRGNLTSNQFDAVGTPPTVNPNITYHAAWNTPLRSIVFFGGAYDIVTLYTPSNITDVAGGWSTRITNGRIPESRTYPCLVPAYGGSKMVLFGGLSGGLSPRGDISILDMSTLTWASGPDDPLDARAQTACAISNDYFISWGGMRMGTIYDGSMIAFNLKTLVWTTDYVVPPQPTTTKIEPTASLSTSAGAGSMPSKGLTSDSHSTDMSNSSRLSAILGATAGVFVLVLAIGGVLIYRARTKHIKNCIDTKEQPARPSSPQEIQGDEFHDPSNTKKDGKKDDGFISPMTLSSFEGYLPPPQSIPYPLPPFSYSNPPPPKSIYPPPPLVVNAYWANTTAPGRNARAPSTIILSKKKDDLVSPPPLPTTFMAGSSDVVLRHIQDQCAVNQKVKKGNAQGGQYGAQRFSQHPHAFMDDSIKPELRESEPNKGGYHHRLARSFLKHPQEQQTTADGGQSAAKNILDANCHLPGAISPQHPHTSSSSNSSSSRGTSSVSYF